MLDAMRSCRFLLFVIAALGVACTSASPATPPACVAYEPAAALDLSQPVVRFRADVQPIFAQSCAFTSCHGSRGGLAGGVYLSGAAAEAADLRASLVGVAAPELPTMPLVTAGDPKASFLMRKLDGDSCLLASSCKDHDCGEAMPRTGELLPVAARDVVRRWIAQGAKDD